MGLQLMDSDRTERGGVEGSVCDDGFGCDNGIYRTEVARRGAPGSERRLGSGRVVPSLGREEIRSGPCRVSPNPNPKGVCLFTISLLRHPRLLREAELRALTGRERRGSPSSTGPLSARES